MQAHGPVKPIGYSPPIAANDTAAVSEPPPSRSHSRGSPPVAERRSLFDRLVDLVSPGPDSREELMETLADAEKRELIEPESLAMLELL